MLNVYGFRLAILRHNLSSQVGPVGVMELCVQSGIEMRVKPEITMAIKNILAAPLLAAISVLLHVLEYLH